MFNFLKSLLPKRIEPEVGMILEDKVWDDWTTIKITKVSCDKKNVQYTYTQINGKTAIDNTNSNSWDFLLTQYRLMEQKNKV